MTRTNENTELTPWLANSAFFAGLDEQAVNRIVSVAKSVKYDTGHILFFQDDPGDALYMIEEGAIEISLMAASGKKLSLNIMKPGDVFGEIAVLDGGRRTATATMLEPTSLLRITRSDLVSLMRGHPEVATDLIAMLCNRLRWVSRIVEDLGLLGIQERLASRLMILDRRFSDSRGNLPLSQGELADFLGATRESINKALRGWQDDGLIGLSRGSVRILDHTGLESLISSEH